MVFWGYPKLAGWFISWKIPLKWMTWGTHGVMPWRNLTKKTGDFGWRENSGPGCCPILGELVAFTNNTTGIFFLKRSEILWTLSYIYPKIGHFFHSCDSNWPIENLIWMTIYEQKMGGFSRYKQPKWEFLLFRAAVYPLVI